MTCERGVPSDLKASAPDPDEAWKELESVNGWLKHAEANANATLAAAGGAGATLYCLLRGPRGLCELSQAYRGLTSLSAATANLSA